MRNSPFASVVSILVAVGIPLAVVACSSNDEPPAQQMNQSGGTGGATGTGGSGTGGTAMSTGGSGGTGATGGTGTGGTGGAGGTTGGTGGTGATTGGSAGMSHGGAGAGGTAAGGAPGGGMGGMSNGGVSNGGMGMGGMGMGGMAGAPMGGMAGGAGSGSGAFTLTSPDQADGMHFAHEFTCAAMNGSFGSGVNPELDWSGVPAGTKSFAMTFIDTKLGEDNAMGEHWAMWDVPPSVMKFPKGTTMLTGDLAGAKQTNKFLAPCPSGDDTYAFTLYALPTDTLDVSGAEGSGAVNSAGVKKVITALRAATPLGKAVLTGTSSAMGQ